MQSACLISQHCVCVCVCVSAGTQRSSLLSQSFKMAALGAGNETLPKADGPNVSWLQVDPSPRLISS